MTVTSITGEFLDGEGLDYIAASYRACGNNGSHDVDGNINTGGAESPEVLAALMSASDHLAVVANDHLPTILVRRAGQPAGRKGGTKGDILICAAKLTMSPLFVLPKEELNLGHQFGSAHSARINVAFADGRSEFLAYDVDLEVLNRMGGRRDGMPLE